MLMWIFIIIGIEATLNRYYNPRLIKRHGQRKREREREREGEGEIEREREGKVDSLFVATIVAVQ